MKCKCDPEIKTGQTSVMCCNICGLPDEEFWQPIQSEEIKPSVSGEDKNERVYKDYKQHEDDHIIEAWYFEAALAEEKRTGYTILGFSSWDGSGYWMKDGKKSVDDVYATPRLDATHVIWYNK